MYLKKAPMSYIFSGTILDKESAHQTMSCHFHSLSFILFNHFTPCHLV